MTGVQFNDRVRIRQRRSSRWQVTVDDGLVIAERPGWVLVFSPEEIDGQRFNIDPRNAEWFPLNARNSRIEVTRRINGNDH